MGIRITSRQLAFDVALAAAALAVGLTRLPDAVGPAQVVGPVLAVVNAGALAVRRVWPGSAAVVALASTLVASLFVPIPSDFWGMGVPIAILVHGAGRRAGARLGVAALVLVLLVMPAMAIHLPEFREVESQVFPLLVFGSAWVAGRVIRRLQAQGNELRAALRTVDEQQGELRRQALRAERTRIAREMHDVVGHGISVMVVQAGAARFGLPDDATEARASLLEVERIGRDVLGELRGVVSLLREDDGPGVQPSSGVGDLPALAERMRAAGLDVRLDLAEGVRADPGRGLVAYRVVQEGLTNVLRHAGATRAEVRVADDSGVLRVEVVDAGAEPGRPSGPGAGAGGGLGLAGLRERVALYGGRLDARPQGEGFALVAEIPLAEGPAAKGSA